MPEEKKKKHARYQFFQGSKQRILINERERSFTAHLDGRLLPGDRTAEQNLVEQSHEDTQVSHHKAHGSVYSTVSRGVPRYPAVSAVFRGIQWVPELCRGIPRCSEVSRGIQWVSEVSRGIPRCSKVSRGVPRYPEVFSGFPSYPEVSRGIDPVQVPWGTAEGGVRKEGPGEEQPVDNVRRKFVLGKKRRKL